MTRVVVMGVSGAGKSTVGAALADALAVPFLEGDDVHAPAAVAKMRRGTPLTDADRAPWLDAVGGWLSARPGGVASCSALRRAYRDTLRAHAGDLFCVLLTVDVETLQRRVDRRPHHFMPAVLLASQLATLEPLCPDEAGMTLDGGDRVEELVAAVTAAVGG